jgi:hypothetical protein
MSARIKSDLLMAGIGALVSYPGLCLAAMGSGFTRLDASSNGFLVGGLIVVAILLAAWFDFLARLMGSTRGGLMGAGWVAAAFTTISFVLLYALWNRVRGHAPCTTGCGLLLTVTLIYMWPLSIIFGSLGGWIVGIPEFREP